MGRRDGRHGWRAMTYVLLSLPFLVIAAAATLAPALVPLAVIPYAGTHTRRHPLIALSAAPFIAAAAIRSRR